MMVDMRKLTAGEVSNTQLFECDKGAGQARSRAAPPAPRIASMADNSTRSLKRGLDTADNTPAKRLRNIASDLDAIVTENVSLKSRLEDASRDNNLLRLGLNSSKDARALWKSRYEAAKIELGSLPGQLLQERRALKSQKNAYENLAAKMRLLQPQIAAHEQEAVEYSLRNQDLEAEVHTLKLQLESQTKQRKRDQSVISYLYTYRDTLQGETRSLKQQLKEQEEQTRRDKKEIKALRADNRTLELKVKKAKKGWEAFKEVGNILDD
ncbi:hypothetical protein N0V90_005420 [Kalmusia sp. IMI 367209]|nr:hypothetical protein N0V90_005420 [Kalmusia sp. IMI 367209]